MVFIIASDFNKEYIVEANSEQEAKTLVRSKLYDIESIVHIRPIPSNTVIEPRYNFMEGYIELDIK